MRRGPMRTGRLTVIYIAGAGRSGSTILDRILGTVPRVTSCNETVRVWRNGFLENLGCACGSRFRDCPFWSAVAEEAFPSGEPNPERTDGLQWEVSRSRYFPRLLADPSPQSSFGARLAEYRATLGPLYRAIAEVSGCDVLVDSSKLPGEALVLAGIPGIDVRVVHLVRDARAVAHSWRRDRRDPGLRRRQDRHPHHLRAVRGGDLHPDRQGRNSQHPDYGWRQQRQRCIPRALAPDAGSGCPGAPP